MIQYLEDILREKTKDKQTEILLAQWNYDKKVIPAALQAVSNLFPHYSLHDESHSITIINNIVRILGKENIQKLSAIDIWLILEAAYSHDIGMVVSSEKLIEAIKSQKFIDFFKELIQDKKSGLHEFAIQFDIIDNQIIQKNNLLNIELNDAIKFILAEFFRKVHAERSQEIINNPTTELSLLSPRGVIPPRIFNLLANICSNHTKNFEEVLKLPFSQVGIDLEDAHPRFIACLLRMGDLLDLDNNRFSEVMLRTLTKLPIETLNHKAKHLSIEQFRVDREVIEITAKCKDYDTANITQHWFNYLNSEISNQTINWNIIVPFKELGYLPTIGSLKVELIDYDFIDGKNKPKFSVDTDKALALLQGAGIYDGAYQCIREILQNAVDSTLIRIYLENKDRCNFKTPNSAEFLEISRNYSIKVNIDDDEEVDLWKSWKIKIEDNGVGISSNDLRYLMNTGSSSKNLAKQHIIDEMPVWMRPSGTFGIGFQSIFMLTDLVKITTKSYFTEEYQIIELNSPNSPKDGDILIQKKETSHANKPGASILIHHKTKAIPDGYSIKSEHKNASRLAHNYDPFSHKSLDIELTKIFDEVLIFADKSYIPIKLFVNNSNIEINLSENNRFKYYDEINGLEVNIHYDENNIYGYRSFTYYKNQNVDNGLFIQFLGIELNIHKDKASEVLTLNRNKVKDEYKDYLYEQVLDSLFRVITKNFEDIFPTDKSKTVGSMFLNFNYADKLKSLEGNKYEQWKLFKINTAEKEDTLLDMLTKSNKLTLVLEPNIHNRTPNNDVFELLNDELTIKCFGACPNFEYTKFFLFKAKEFFSSISKTVNGNIKTIIYSKEEQKSPISEQELNSIIENLISYSYSARAIIPCIEKYFHLRLKEGAWYPYIYHYVLDEYLHLQFPKMLSPFIKEESGENIKILKKAISTDLIDWVYTNRHSESTTKEMIKESYEIFCEDFNLEEINAKNKQKRRPLV